MHFISNNTVFKKSILGFLVVLMFLAPLSVTLLSFGKTENNARHVTVETNIVRAQATNPADPEFQIQPIGNGVTPAIDLTPNLVNAPAQNSANTVTQPTKKPDAQIPGLGKTNTKFAEFAEGIGYTVLSTAAVITWVGGNILEFAVDELVFGMGGLINEKGFGGAIDLTWKVIRDICNLVFIFGFIYTGIRTIIDPESAETKRFVAQIIIAALLINFSLFFTKIIIDFSNYTAIQLYQTVIGNTFDNDISTKFANLLGLSSFYDTPDGVELAKISMGGLWFFIMGSIMLLVAGFVLAAGGILLVVRFVALIFIMIFSPVLFAASVFPQTEEYSSKLWHNLLSYAFFAPLFLLLLLISLTVLDRSKEVLGIGASISDALLNSSHDAFEVILNFVIVIMFLIFSLKSASHLGVAGGEMAVHMGDHLRKNVQGAIGRNTVGWASRKALHAYEHFDARTADSKGWKAAKFAGRALTLGAVDDMTIKHALHAGENAKFGSHYSNEDVDKHDKKRKADQARINETHDLQHSIEHVSDPTATVTDEERIKMERDVSRASSEQLLALLKEFDGDTEKYNALIANISANQFDGLMKLKSDELDDTKKTKISKTRATAVQDRLIAGLPPPAVGAPPNTITNAIGKADGKDLDALDFNETIMKNAGHLSTKQIDDMSSLTTTSKKTLKDAREKGILDTFRSGGAVGTVAGANEIFSRFTNDSERAKLPAKILTDRAAIPHLNTKVLAKIIDNDSITQADRNVIKGNLAGNATFDNFFRTPLGQQF